MPRFYFKFHLGFVWVFCCILATAPRPASSADDKPTSLSARITQAQADMRSIGIALEAYHIDHGTYPPDHTLFFFQNDPMPEIFACLTTPVAYLRSVPPDVFTGPTPRGTYGKPPDAYSYVSEIWSGAQAFRLARRPLAKWNLVSNGPDRLWNAGEYALLGQECLLRQVPGSDPIIGTWQYGCLYDATNGALSAGDIVLLGPTPEITQLGRQLSQKMKEKK